MNAALLLRVSTERQAQKKRGEVVIPLDRQEREGRAFCEAQGWTVVDVLSDPGVSGGKDELSRDGLAALLALADRGDVQRVVVWSFSRLARDEDLAGHISWLLRRAGAEAVSITEPETHPLLRAVGRWKDAEDRRQARRYALSTYGIRRQEGRKIARDPFGYEWSEDGSTLLPYEPEATRYRQAFLDLLGGMSQRQICAREGWHKMTLRHLLRSRTPIGDYVYGAQAEDGERVVHEGHHAPIVERETWQAVQDLLDANRRTFGYAYPIATAKATPLAVSGLLFCATCGERLSIDGTRTLRDGTVKRVYACRRGHVRRTLEAPAAKLLAALAGELTRPGLVADLAEAAESIYAAGRDSGALEARKLELERKVKNFAAAVEDAETPQEAREWRRKWAATRAELAEVETSLEAISPDLSGLAERLAQMVDRLVRVQPAAAEREAGPILRELVERVNVPTEGELDVTFRLPAEDGTARRPVLRWQVRVAA